jgi:nitrogen fixation/metabolism regulation signal transduction histidine kinase
VKELSHEKRVLLLALAAGFPGSAGAVALLFTGDFSPRFQWTFSILIVVLWLGCAFAVKNRVVFPLQTLSNLLAALREGDYSIRGRRAKSEDALGEVMIEVNALGATLREQRLGALEATNLLRTVMAEIDVAIFTFDHERRLRLVNRAGERLLAQPAERLLGRGASQLGLDDCLEGDAARTLQKTFPGGVGRWGMRRGMFREQGLPHHLVVLADLSQALREEERQAWQRLLRVLGHELNNSLAPIRSIAGSLVQLLSRDPLPEDWHDDMKTGLDVIAGRSLSLSRFMEAYSTLARLPEPKLRPMDAGEWIRQAVSLETRQRVVLVPGPRVAFPGDPDQLSQLLINLIRNAVDAALETGGGVTLGWRKDGSYLEVWVEDDGPGLPTTSNLFVPFFTTKPGGSGIGLVLSRQIAEAHGGALTLENRKAAKGCAATLRIPL